MHSFIAKRWAAISLPAAVSLQRLPSSSVKKMPNATSGVRRFVVARLLQRAGYAAIEVEVVAADCVKI